MNEWKCVFRDDVSSLNISLIVYRPMGKDVELLTLGENGQMILTLQSPYEMAKPFMVLSPMIAKEFLKSLSEALDNFGIKPDSNSKLEGTLEATKGHLKDLRQLLKLKDNSK